jgi:hypothetical protein
MQYLDIAIYCNILQCNILEPGSGEEAKDLFFVWKIREDGPHHNLKQNEQSRSRREQ